MIRSSCHTWFCWCMGILQSPHHNQRGVVFKLSISTLKISFCSASYLVTVISVLLIIDSTLISTLFKLRSLSFDTVVVSALFVFYNMHLTYFSVNHHFDCSINPVDVQICHHVQQSFAETVLYR